MQEGAHYRRRLIHYHYIENTAKYNELHYAALTDNTSMIIRILSRQASDPWEGETLALKQGLIEVVENWKGLTGGNSPCPLVFDPEDVGKTMKLAEMQAVSDCNLETLQTIVLFGRKGWVPAEHYEAAIAAEGEPIAMGRG